jgi:hypothetical protein
VQQIKAIIACKVTQKRWPFFILATFKQQRSLSQGGEGGGARRFGRVKPSASDLFRNTSKYLWQKHNLNGKNQLRPTSTASAVSKASTVE